MDPDMATVPAPMLGNQVAEFQVRPARVTLRGAAVQPLCLLL